MLQICHHKASKNFAKLAREFLLQNDAFYKMLDQARRLDIPDRIEGHVRQIANLKFLACDEEDLLMIDDLRRKALEIAIESGAHLQKCFTPLYLDNFQPPELPSELTTERYFKALRNFRTKFEIVVTSTKDIHAAQKEIFIAFQTFISGLIDDILAIMGPPPCGFDLRAMGSIGRREICPYSDLEYMILIAEDTPKVNTYFVTFAKIFELQIACFGECPDVLPFDFTCLARPNVKG